jgi:glucan phosphorylase
MKGDKMKGHKPVPRSNPLDRLNCGPVKFSGSSDALYERHLTFDQVVPVAAATPRDRFEAVARSVRDLLSQRWIKTEQTYRTQNAKRVYYLSLELLMGRSLANNITNLLLDSVWSQFCKKHKIDPLEIIEQEPDAGLGNGGLGRLAACFLDSMATLGIPGMGSGLRYDQHLADLNGYSEAHTRLGELYTDHEQWSRKAVLNIAASRTFSSDRTIAEYARDIWHAEPCPVQ